MTIENRESRTIAEAAYDGAELLDITSRIKVFNMLNRSLRWERYRIVLLAGEPDPFDHPGGAAGGR